MASLQGGSAPAQMIRDTGTANAVLGFWATGFVEGTESLTTLPTTVFMQAGDGFAQEPFGTSTASKLWIKVAGVWKETTTWIKISGVWKEATVWYNDGGTWK